MANSETYVLLLAALVAVVSASGWVTNQDMIGRTYSFVNQTTVGDETAKVYLFTPGGQKWANPYTHKVEHMYQEIMVTSYDQQSVQEGYYQIETWDQVTTTYDSQLSLSASLGTKNLSIGASFRHDRRMYDQVTKNSSSAVLTSRALVKLWGYDVDQLSVKIVPGFTRAVSYLPADCKFGSGNNTCDFSYCYFLSKTGDWVVNGATFGGAVNFTVAMSKEYMSHVHKEWVSTQAGITFKWQKEAHGVAHYGQNYTKNSVDKAFLGNSTLNNFVEGGNRTLFTNGTLDQWLGSVDSNATWLILHSNFAPIYSLIPPTSPVAIAKIANVRAAIIKTMSTGVCHDWAALTGDPSPAYHLSAQLANKHLSPASQWAFDNVFTRRTQA